MARLASVALFGVCVLSASVARAHSSVLVAASDPTQIAEVDVAKVVAVDSSFWLSVRLTGPVKVAIVVSASSVEPANAADAWLRALDFSTRVRVIPPPDPLAACTDSSGQPADSGSPEPLSLSPSQTSSLSSEVELRRSLTDAGLPVDLAPITDFSAHVAAPFRFVLYEVGQSGATAALRLTDSEPALTVPGIAVAGRDTVPFTLLALAPSAVQPANVLVSDPSDFAVSYLGATASTNYVTARARWLSEDPTRWLLEARASTALFDWTEISAAGEVEPGVSRYFDAASGQSAGRTCTAAAQAARARASQEVADFSCGAADDLARSLSELDFGEVRLTRLFGSIGAAGFGLQSSDEAELATPVVATDFDANDCTTGTSASAPVSVGSSAPGGVSSPRASSSVSSGTVASSDGSTTVVEGSNANVAVAVDSCSGDSSSDDSSDDSCTGDPSNSDSNDSCTGDSSSDPGSTDSCTGDSSSDSDSQDSCSGDSSSSDDDDSSGCGKSDYDGDTCSGNSASSASPDKSTAALAAGQRTQRSRRPRRVHLSLLTLLVALIALPLRRRRPGRSLPAL